MNRRRAGVLAGVAAAGGLTLAAVSPGCPSDPPGAPEGCPETVVAASETWPLILSNSEPLTYDARGDTFNSDNGYMKAKYTAPGTCWVGGKFGSPTKDPQTTSWADWHTPPDGTSSDTYISTEGVTFTGLRLYNSGDGVSTNGQDWLLDSILVDGEAGDRVHDDGIQNDNMKAGKVQDSLFDGVFVFMSSRGGGKDGTGNTVEVADTLVRLRPYQNSYKCDTNPVFCNANGGFYKWANEPATDGKPPSLYVHDSVFRSDQRGLSGGTTFDVNGDGQMGDGDNVIAGLPPGTNCGTGNVLIVGDWAKDPENRKNVDSWTSQCPDDFRVMYVDEGGAEFWDDARDAWMTMHPEHP